MTSQSRAIICVKVIKLFLPVIVIYAMILTYLQNSRVQRTTSKEVNVRKAREYKYILQWTNKSIAPFQFMGQGNATFIKNDCKHTNCFVTDDATFMSVTDFDAIIFNGRNVVRMEPHQLPEQRSVTQKYIIAATESADRFPACDEVLDNFFNWTWTYKLSSDLRFGYITVYDLEGNEVGPAIDMEWPERMEPISESLKKKLSSKSKAATWFVSHCKTNSKREDFVAEVNKELQKFGWSVDIYGSCGQFNCPRKNWRECDKKVENEYYFYFAFENSFAEDYVTEKVLTALNNYAVPVVFGAANYSRVWFGFVAVVMGGSGWVVLQARLLPYFYFKKSPEDSKPANGCQPYKVSGTPLQHKHDERFLPPGSYLNAKELGPKKLAYIMNELIAHKDKYYDFFRWRNHFTFKQTLTSTDMCKLCEALNDDRKMDTVSTWKNFRRWWNGASAFNNC